MGKSGIVIAILAILYTVGIGGMLSPYQSLFMSLTPVNLLITFGLLLWMEAPATTTFYVRMGVVVLLGFIIELIGVNTGYPFGVYEYGVAFGPRVMGTPPLIGVNWFILVYGGLAWIRGHGLPKWLMAILVGLSVTVLDLFMEPVAIALGFWNWEAATVPVQNYISWAVIGSVMAYILMSLPLPKDMKIGKAVFVLQVIFFLILYIFH